MNMINDGRRRIIRTAAGETRNVFVRKSTMLRSVSYTGTDYARPYTTIGRLGRMA